MNQEEIACSLLPEGVNRIIGVILLIFGLTWYRNINLLRRFSI